MSTKTSPDQLHLPEEIQLEAICDNVIVIPLMRGNKKSNVIKIPHKSQHKRWNHLQYGVVIDWGSCVPQTYHDREDRDYEEAQSAIWSINKAATSYKSVAAFGQKRCKSITLKKPYPVGVVKAQNIIWVEDYHEDKFEIADQGEFFD